VARDSIEQRKIKIKALLESIEILKEESTATINKVTFGKVVDLANEMYTDQLTRKISPTSLKNPTSEDFGKIKHIIEEYRLDFKKIKSIVPRKSLQEVNKLKIQIENLIIQVAKYQDEKLLLVEQLEIKNRTIYNLKKEREKIYSDLDQLREKNAY
jgi:hypothetical protein